MGRYGIEIIYIKRIMTCFCLYFNIISIMISYKIIYRVYPIAMLYFYFFKAPYG